MASSSHQQADTAPSPDETTPLITTIARISQEDSGPDIKDAVLSTLENLISLVKTRYPVHTDKENQGESAQVHGTINQVQWQDHSTDEVRKKALERLKKNVEALLAKDPCTSEVLGILCLSRVPWFIPSFIPSHVHIRTI